MKDEIDITSLVKGILASIKKNFLILIILLIAFLAGAYYMFKKDKTLYATEAIIYSNPENPSQLYLIKQVVVYLNKNIKRKNYANVSKILNIERSVADKINDLTIESFDLNTSSVSLNLEIESTENINLIEEGFIQFLNKNNTINEYNELIIQRHKEIDSLIMLKEVELQKLYNDKSEDKSKIIETEFNVGRTKARNNYSLKLASNNLKYVIKFSENVLSVSEKPDISKNLLFALLAWFFSCLIIISILQTIKEVFK